MRRSRKCTLDALEGRDLLSLTPVLGLLAPKAVATTTTGRVTAQDASGTSPNNGGSAGFAGDAGASGITADTATPRANEVARRAFRATFAGRVVQQAPRLVDQESQFYYSMPGNTNQFLHGTLQMRIYTPSTSNVPPSVVATSPFDQLTGSLSISDRSTQSGGLILANLTGDPATVDAKGRPTQMNFFVNGGGGSGGIYASSVGQGTVDITYRGNVAKILIRGSIFRQGIGDPLAVYQTSLQRGV